MNDCDTNSTLHPYEGLAELNQVLKRTSQNLFKEGEIFDTTELEEKLGVRTLTTAVYSMICFLGTFLILCFIGSYLTLYKRHFTKHTKKNSMECRKKESETNDITNNQPESLSKDGQESDCLTECKSFFSCFCLITNGKELFNTSPVKGEISCLHGLRVLSQTTIMIGHILALSMLITTRNLKEHIHHLETWTFHIGVTFLFHSVDTFFLLSGLVNAYSYFQSEVKRKSWFYFYFHRYLRLTPMYLITLAFYSTLFPCMMGSNEFWSTYPAKQICSQYWWRNFFYLSNLYSFNDMCMAWAWSLCCDVQFFVISPLLLVTLMRWPNIGYSLVGLFIGGSAITNFIMTSHFDLPYFFIGRRGYSQEESLFDGFIVRFFNYVDKLYVMPFSRLTSYSTGIIAAYILINWQQRHQQKMSWVVKMCGWTMAVFSLLYVVFGVMETSSYNALNQICFSGALTWVIYVCVTGQGGVINLLLSSKALVPFSRLSYCAYLVHPLLGQIYLLLLKESVELSFVNLGILLTVTASSYIVAFFAYLLFECPFAKMEKLFWKKFCINK